MAIVSGMLLASVLASAYAESFTHFDNYTRAYAAADLVERPMLVVLNPGADSGSDPIAFDALRQTQQRRDLLQDYVVCVLDTTTEHGAKCKELFEADSLPRVVVIDKQQKQQIFRTSQKLDDELLTQVLISYQTGVAGPNPLAKTSSARATISQPLRRAPLRYSQPCST